MSIPVTTLKFQGVQQNTALHLRDRAHQGGQYSRKKISVPATTLVTLIGAADLFGAKTKTITVVNRTTGTVLGAGSIVLVGPTEDQIDEQISTGDFDTIAAGSSKSVSFETAHRFWAVQVLGGASDTEVDVYIDVNQG